MECPGCNKETHKATWDGKRFACADCFKPEFQSHDALLHRVRLNKFGVRMTYADANRIKTNKLRADGRYRPAPRWRDIGD